jgi:hypothetical protein
MNASIMKILFVTYQSTIYTYPSIYRFRYNEPCKCIRIFQLTNIIFSTMKKQLIYH